MFNKPVVSALREKLQTILSVFSTFLVRRRRIDTLKNELKALEALDEADEKNLTEAVSETGPVIVDKHMLEVESLRRVKKAALGAQELIDAVKRFAPYSVGTVESAYDRALAEKASENENSAKIVKKFDYRETKPGERYDTCVWVVR